MNRHLEKLSLLKRAVSFASIKTVPTSFPHTKANEDVLLVAPRKKRLHTLADLVAFSSRMVASGSSAVTF